MKPGRVPKSYLAQALLPPSERCHQSVPWQDPSLISTKLGTIKRTRHTDFVGSADGCYIFLKPLEASTPKPIVFDQQHDRRRYHEPCIAVLHA